MPSCSLYRAGVLVCSLLPCLSPQRRMFNATHLSPVHLTFWGRLWWLCRTLPHPELRGSISMSRLQTPHPILTFCKVLLNSFNPKERALFLGFLIRQNFSKGLLHRELLLLNLNFPSLFLVSHELVMSKP